MASKSGVDKAGKLWLVSRILERIAVNRDGYLQDSPKDNPRIYELISCISLHPLDLRLYEARSK
jgi:hypothetical protein